MRILCINYEYPPVGGGGGVASKGLAEALVQKGHHIDVVTSGMKDLPEFEVINGVHVYRVKCYRRNRVYVGSFELLTTLYTMYNKAIQLVEQHTYDINHTHFIAPSGIVSYWLMKKTGLPYIITAHGSDVPGYNPDRFQVEHFLLKRMWKRITKHSSAIICPSNYLKNLILKNECETDIHVVPNGYTPIDEGVNYQAKRNTILVATRMFKRKGVQYFLEALRNIQTDWEILIAGDGPYLEELKKQSKTVKANIKFLGFLSREEMNAAYRKAKIFIFPSIRENYPMVLIEAMDSGCAVITTNAEGCSEVVSNAARKTEPGNVDQLREALAGLLTNNNEITRLSLMAEKRVNQLTWPNIATETALIFGNLINTLEHNIPKEAFAEIKLYS